ncbi:hypothetical protein PIB30_023556 [Stylosanthes scabra]|uniref:Uncharacterized protein n=1 Tax=Stylosanthes scabra TaxID=79078 RepID=A0ABU6W9L4_9FABA|nr:hypothetical protein [Stylosanthes scabra]
MAKISVAATPRQPSVPAGAVRSGNINRKNTEGWHIATKLEPPRILHARRNSYMMPPPTVLMPYFRDAIKVGNGVDELPLRLDGALSVCGEVAARDE